jgi:hypothetical protein
MLPFRAASGLVREFTCGPDLDDEGGDFERILRFGAEATTNAGRRTSYRLQAEKGELVQKVGDFRMARKLSVEPSVTLRKVVQVPAQALAVPGFSGLADLRHRLSGSLIEPAAETLAERVKRLSDARSMLVLRIFFFRRHPLERIAVLARGRAYAVTGCRRVAIAAAILPAWCRLFSMKMRPISVPPRRAPAR